MDRLQFPETTTPGQFFNDFINGHPVFDLYEETALHVEEYDGVAVLHMEGNDEKVYINRSLSDSAWISYDVYDALTALELNWYISACMRCDVCLGDSRVYEHPSGVLLTVTRRSEGYYTYMLCLSDGQGKR